MNFKGIKYQFTATPWQYSGKAAWIFIALPREIAREIRTHFKSEEEGWGRLKVTAQIGNSEWSTAIWFDRKSDTYLLPLKAEIRLKESIAVDKMVKVKIWV
jgi:hypothetical protein